MYTKDEVDRFARNEKLAQMELKNLWVLHDQVVRLFRIYFNKCTEYPNDRVAKQNRLYFARYIRAINQEIAYRRVAGKPWQRPT